MKKLELMINAQYQNLKRDIELFMKNFIEKFGFSFSQEVLNKNSAFPGDAQFLQNKNCVIGFNIWESFPMQDVVFHFYLFDENNYENRIDDRHLLSFLGIDENKYSIFCSAIDTPNILIPEEDEPYRGYVEAIISNTKLLLEFYYPLMDGSYTYKMYKNWLKYIANNYNLNDKNIILPSYMEFIKSL